MRALTWTVSGRPCGRCRGKRSQRLCRTHSPPAAQRAQVLILMVTRKAESCKQHSWPKLSVNSAQPGSALSSRFSRSLPSKAALPTLAP